MTYEHLGPTLVIDEDKPTAEVKPQTELSCRLDQYFIDHCDDEEYMNQLLAAGKALVASLAKHNLSGEIVIDGVKMIRWSPQANSSETVENQMRRLAEILQVEPDWFLINNKLAGLFITELGKIANR